MSRTQFKLNRPVAIPLFIISLGVVVGTADNACALETNVCRIEVVVDGRPLTEYAARGTTYIEALKGHEYSLRLTNLIGRRIAIALAVDGLNTIDAKTTAASKASKWVLGPYQSTTISGWQVSSTDARRFYFTTESNSYGAWLGRDDNLGVIEAVVYREELPKMTLGRWFGERSMETSESAARDRRAAKPKAEAGEPADADDLAATGIGRKVDHRVRRVHLDLENKPAARLRIRYEYRQQLVHLGILPSAEELDALDRRERAQGFSDFSFAPDPFTRGR